MWATIASSVTFTVTMRGSVRIAVLIPCLPNTGEYTILAKERAGTLGAESGQHLREAGVRKAVLLWYNLAGLKRKGIPNRITCGRKTL
jgi:hypothetical protein